MGWGSCDSVAIGWPAEWLLWRGAFEPVSFDLEAGRYRPDFELWQRVVQGKQENVIHANLPGVPRQRSVVCVVCVCMYVVCVCALVGHQVTELQ